MLPHRLQPRHGIVTTFVLGTLPLPLVIRLGRPPSLLELDVAPKARARQVARKGVQQDVEVVHCTRRLDLPRPAHQPVSLLPVIGQGRGAVEVEQSAAELLDR
eukprot:scaffold15998_cov111-Isochrysis_galbana.AAC.9